MKLIIDSADCQAIRKLMEYYPIEGVTTNPTIVTRSKRAPYEVLGEIRSIIQDLDLHVQVISTKAEDIIAEAKVITDRLGSRTCVKIPVTFEGVKAIKNLASSGYRVTATAVYTIQQAYMAASSGAEWVAPYVNRIEMLGQNGIDMAIRMQNLFDLNEYDCSILGASFKRIDQLTGLAEAGIPAATVAPDLLFSLLDNPYVDSAVSVFNSDFAKQYGEGKTMADL